jgi:hypothetical protein
VENLVKILETLKGFTDKRFYVLVILLFLGFLIWTFQDTIKEKNFKPQELQEVSNETGLTSSLEALKIKHPLVTGYAFYLYQPLAESYYKTLNSTDIKYMNDNKFFKSIPLNTQKYLNYRLVDKEYVLMSYKNAEEKPYTDMYASDVLLFYNVRVKETIAEVIITFNVAPTPEEIEVIVRELRTIKYYII